MTHVVSGSKYNNCKGSKIHTNTKILLFAVGSSGNNDLD